MDLERIRRLLARRRVSLRISDHALIEARKDGLTTEDLEATLIGGVEVEDYGARALVLAFTEYDKLPCHVVLEYVPGRREITIVTAYIPDSREWRPDWKTRKEKRQR